MDRATLRALRDAETDRIFQSLDTQQFTHPHRSLAEVVHHASMQIGICADAARSALQQLQLDPAMVIGRLRRSELLQLARTTRRFGRQAASIGSDWPSQPL